MEAAPEGAANYVHTGTLTRMSEENDIKIQHQVFDPIDKWISEVDVSQSVPFSISWPGEERHVRSRVLVSDVDSSIAPDDDLLGFSNPKCNLSDHWHAMQLFKGKMKILENLRLELDGSRRDHINIENKIAKAEQKHTEVDAKHTTHIQSKDASVAGMDSPLACHALAQSTATLLQKPILSIQRFQKVLF